MATITPNATTPTTPVSRGSHQEGMPNYEDDIFGCYTEQDLKFKMDEYSRRTDQEIKTLAAENESLKLEVTLKLGDQNKKIEDLTKANTELQSSYVKAAEEFAKFKSDLKTSEELRRTLMQSNESLQKDKELLLQEIQTIQTLYRMAPTTPGKAKSKTMAFPSITVAEPGQQPSSAEKVDLLAQSVVALLKTTGIVGEEYTYKSGDDVVELAQRLRALNTGFSGLVDGKIVPMLQSAGVVDEEYAFTNIIELGNKVDEAASKHRQAQTQLALLRTRFDLVVKQASAAIRKIDKSFKPSQFKASEMDEKKMQELLSKFTLLKAEVSSLSGGLRIIRQDFLAHCKAIAQDTKAVFGGK